MTDKEYVEFLTKCANIPYEDYSWLKDHCYRTLNRPCSPNARNEHLAVLNLIKEHEERQQVPVSKKEESEDTGIKLDEAIERYASNAEFERTHGNLQGCLEFRQLAKWLRELKMYRRFLLKYKFEADPESENK